MTYPSVLTYPSAETFPDSIDRDISITADVRADRFTVTLGALMPRTIPVSLGAVEYIEFDIAEVTGQVITAASVKVAVGTYTTPGSWQTPDVLTFPTASTAVAKLLVGRTYTLTSGRYWCWVLLGDTPEVVPVRCLVALTIT